MTDILIDFKFYHLISLEIIIQVGYLTNQVPFYLIKIFLLFLLLKIISYLIEIFIRFCLFKQ